MPLLSKKSKDKPNVGSRGDLRVPPNDQDKVRYLVPGIVYNIKGKNKPLFLNAPTQKRSKYKGDMKFETEQLLTDSKTPEIQTTATAKTKKGEIEHFMVGEQLSHTNETALGKKQTVEVLARPFEIEDPKHPGKMIKHPFLMQVATFEKKSSNAGEKEEETRMDLGHDVTITNVGYMYKEDLIPQEKFKPVNDNIFPHEPSTEDVIQAGMGNCFLLASINAVLSQKDGPDLIKNMMVQQDDGTVIVRLFDPEKLQPFYVKVDNTEHYMDDDTPAVGHTAPWVHILEQAYTGLGYEIYTEDKKNEYQAVHNIEPLKNQDIESKIGIRPQAFVTTLAGGQAPLAITLLTGERAKKYEFNSMLEGNKSATLYPFNSQNTRSIDGLFYSANDLLDSLYQPRSNKFLTNLTNEKGEPDPSKIDPILEAQIPALTKAKDWGDSNLPNILGDDLDSWVLYNTKLQILYPDTKRQLSQLISQEDKVVQGAEYAPSNTKEFQDILNELKNLTPPPPDNVMKKFETYVKDLEDTKTISGPIGSGQYSENQQKLFTELQSQLEQGKVLTASTQDTFIDTKDIGLVSKHEYTITDVFKKEHEGQELLMVQIRNPWQRMGVEYKSDSNGGLTPTINEKAAEFALDMNDFYKNFESYTVGSANRLKNIDTIEVTPPPVKSEVGSTTKETLLNLYGSRENAVKNFEKQINFEEKTSNIQNTVDPDPARASSMLKSTTKESDNIKKESDVKEESNISSVKPG